MKILQSRWRILCGIALVFSCIAPVLAQDKTSGRNIKQEAVEAYKAKDYALAADLFYELYVQTSNGNILFNVGLCQMRAGQNSKAMESLKKFVELVPNSRSVKKAKAMIEEIRASLGGELIDVLVRSEPSGANVFVNERSSGVIGVTPFTLKLAPGAHTVIVDKGEYEAQSKQISITKDSARELFFQLYPSGQMGALKLMISEREADVMVNNRRIGRSPIRDNLRLPNGSHDLLVIKPGYTTWRSKVEVSAGKTNTVQVDLLPERALSSTSSTSNPQLYPMLTVGAGVLLAGGAVVMGAQAQSLYDKLESRSSQGILIHPSDKSTGQTWVMWTNILSAMSGLAITGGGTWWYYSLKEQAPSAEISSWSTQDLPMNVQGGDR